MATLTAWKFDTPTGADAVFLKLKQLQEQALIQLHDAAVVSWAGRSDSFIREVREKVSPGTSALFLPSSDAVHDRLAQEAHLRDAFGLED